MKYSFHIQPEQFEYIGFEYEANEGLTDEQIRAAIEDYQRSKKALVVQGGIPDKDFNKILDEYLTTKTIVNGQDIYEKLSPLQRDVIQAIKRSYQRLKK